MAEPDKVPTLSEWVGGEPAIASMTRRFYEKVPLDPLLGPVFAGMDPHHAQHVAKFIAEVFGGGRPYSDNGGSHRSMIVRHLGRALSEEQRKRWISLMLETADEVGVPSDPEFRSAFVGYLEWGTRIALINSQPGVEPPKNDPPMPRWGWGPPGGPYRG